MTFYFFYYILVGLGLSLILMPMILGYFPFLASFMGSSVWTPMSRLTYSTYLMHLTILSAVMMSTRQSAFLNNMTVFIAFASMFVLSLVGGLIVYLLVEAPFINIEKIFRRKSSS
jgi:peptidoglycan/LPS O-acetylase OafA/YrhL|mmetsp:Transcript_25416/g.4209  ORF Transcript_25416/g.4209 Transcript_25416/m.4209 type:complete len:115 (+) Transcript_25416:1003-1347(+)